MIALLLEPLEIAVIVCLQWLIVGEAVLAALALAAVSFAVSNVGGRAIDAHNAARSALSDTRIKVLSEILFGVKVVKANGWIPRFHERINGVVRRESLHALRKKQWYCCRLQAWTGYG